MSETPPNSANVAPAEVQGVNAEQIAEISFPTISPEVLQIAQEIVQARKARRAEMRATTMKRTTPPNYYT